VDRLCVWRVGGVHERVLGEVGCVSGVLRDELLFSCFASLVYLYMFM